MICRFFRTTMNFARRIIETVHRVANGMWSNYTVQFAYITPAEQTTQPLNCWCNCRQWTSDVIWRRRKLQTTAASDVTLSLALSSSSSSSSIAAVSVSARRGLVGLRIARRYAVHAQCFTSTLTSFKTHKPSTCRGDGQTSSVFCWRRSHLSRFVINCWFNQSVVQARGRACRCCRVFSCLCIGLR